MSHASSTRAFGQPLNQQLPSVSHAKSAPHFAQVSELAYQLWKDSGFAPGTELEYWYDAEQQLLAAESAGNSRDRS